MLSLQESFFVAVLSNASIVPTGRSFEGWRVARRQGFLDSSQPGRFNSLQWEDPASGWKLDTNNRRLYLMGIGEIKANYHRPISGVPKAITVKREGTKWWLNVRCMNVPARPLARTCTEVGIDLGVVNQVATSDGELIKGKRFGANAQERLARAERELAAKKQ